MGEPFAMMETEAGKPSAMEALAKVGKPAAMEAPAKVGKPPAMEATRAMEVSKPAAEGAMDAAKVMETMKAAKAVEPGKPAEAAVEAAKARGAVEASEAAVGAAEPPTESAKAPVEA